MGKENLLCSLSPIEEIVNKFISLQEEEIEAMLKKIQELGKAELNAAIAREKSSHMENMSEANLNVNNPFMCYIGIFLAVAWVSFVF